MRSDRPRLPEAVLLYSHADQRLVSELLKQLAPMRDRLDCWSDKDISAGQRWREEIEKALSSSKIAVLLVSSSFLASDFIAERELPPLLDAARENNLQIIWIPLSACVYTFTEISEYQAAHPPERPLDTLRKPERQRALVKICEKIWSAVESSRAEFDPPIEASTASQRALRDEAPSPASEPAAWSGDRGHAAARACLAPSTIEALAKGDASPGGLPPVAMHLLGTPPHRGCRKCQRQLAKRFIEAAHSLSGPEFAAANDLWTGSLRTYPGPLVEILGSEAAGSDLLAEWVRWERGRRGPIDAHTVRPVILASYDLRFEPGTPGLILHAELAAKMADASADPWTRAMAYAWLSRAWGIKGQFHKAWQAIKIALQAARQSKGERSRVARAYSLYQLADLHFRLRDFGRARKHFESAITIFRQSGPSRMVQNAGYALALSCREAGERNEALDRLRKILVASDDHELITFALQTVMEILSDPVQDGGAGSAELALCLRAVVGESSRPELNSLSSQARDFWRDGRIAAALGVPQIALSHYDEARSLFLSLAPDVAGMYEAAIISLDMIGVLQKNGSLQEMKNLAWEAATIFRALDADISWLLALGAFRQLEDRARVNSYLAHARLALEVAEKQRLFRLARRRFDLTDDAGMGSSSH